MKPLTAGKVVALYYFTARNHNCLLAGFQVICIKNYEGTAGNGRFTAAKAAIESSAGKTDIVRTQF